MTDVEPDRIKITIPLSPTLLKLFDDACFQEFNEPDKRSLKIRSLMREYIEKSKK